MKKILLLLLFAVSSVSAQTNTEITEKQLVGKWLFKDIAEDGGTDNGISLKERKELLEGMHLEFRDDKTCVTGFVMDREGTWTFDASTKVITIKEGKTVTWKIYSFKENEMVMARNDSKQKLLFSKQ